MAEGTVRGLVIATVCETVEDFVERYHTRIDDNTLFVSVFEERALGTECAFVILLDNREPVLAGICEVLELFPTASNRYDRRGMRLGIRRLGIASERVFSELAARAAGRTGPRFARGSSVPMPEAPDLEVSQTLCIEIDDNDAIPVDLTEEQTAP